MANLDHLLAVFLEFDANAVFLMPFLIYFFMIVSDYLFIPNLITKIAI